MDRKRRLLGDSGAGLDTSASAPTPVSVDPGDERPRALVRSASAGDAAEATGSEPFMRPFQNRSLVVALHESKRTASDLTVRVRQLEAEREQLRQTVSCVRRHWSQLERDVEHLLSSSSAELAAAHTSAKSVCAAPSGAAAAVAAGTGEGVADVLRKLLESQPPLLTATGGASLSVGELERGLAQAVAFSTSLVSALLTAMRGGGNKEDACRRVYDHFLHSERKLSAERDALSDALSLCKSDAASLREQLRLTQEDVRRTHRYIARVLHDNPTLKLSMFGIGSEVYMPPAVVTPLGDIVYKVDSGAAAPTAAEGAGDGGVVPAASDAVGAVVPPAATAAAPAAMAVTTPVPAACVASDGVATAAGAPTGGELDSEATTTIDRLQVELQQQAVVAESRLAEINELCAQLTTSRQQVERLQRQPLTQEALQSSPAYLELLYQLNTERVKRSDAQKRCDVLEAIAKDLQYKLGVMMADVKLTDQSARAAYEADILEAHEQVKVQALEIDSLKLQVATAEGQRQAYNSAQKQLEQQEALISSLREELAVLRGEGGKSVAEAKAVSEQVAQLERKVTRLAAVIKDKDVALETLKAQERTAKREERNTAVLMSSEAVSAAAARIESMEKEVAVNDSRVLEARTQMAAVREEHEKLSAALFAARGDAATVKEEKVALERAYETVSGSLEASLERSKALTVDLNSSRDSLAQCRSECVALRSLVDVSSKERADLDGQLKTAGELQAAMKKQVADAVAALAAAQAELTERRGKGASQGGFVEESWDEAVRNARAEFGPIIARTVEVDEAVRRMETLVAEKDDAVYQKKRLEEEVSRVRKALLKAEQAAAMASDRNGAAPSKKPRRSLAEDEMDYFKKAVTCSVCHEGIKDRVILKCLHLFCQSCVDENLRTRHRKCPACGLAFAASDVKNIYLV